MLSRAEAAAWDEIVEALRPQSGTPKRGLHRVLAGLAEAVDGYLVAASAHDAGALVRVVGVAEALRVLDARATI